VADVDADATPYALYVFTNDCTQVTATIALAKLYEISLVIVIVDRLVVIVIVNC